MRSACPIILDIEASGFGMTSYPIEVGVVDQKGARYCRLVQPASGWEHWSDSAQAVHGIPRNTLLEQGVPCRQICEQMNSLFSGLTLYSDGWVVDYPWLLKLFEAGRCNMAFRVSALDMILSEQQMRIWHQTKEEVIEQHNGQRHRASLDAQIIQQTYVQSLQRIETSKASEIS